MIKVICNNSVIAYWKDIVKFDYVAVPLPNKDDIITYGSIRYIVLRREFNDNGDIFIIVSQL